jgi:hypothetical protein
MRFLIAFLMLCSAASAEDIFRPTGRYAVTVETTKTIVRSKPKRYLVKFTADYCGPCKTWDSKELPAMVAAGFTPTIVDSTNGNTWGVTSLPEFWIVDIVTRKPVEKITGYTSAQELLQMLREASSCDPVAVTVAEKTKTKTKTESMSHGEMVRLHTSLHGGGAWSWPGDLASHLQTTHGVSTGKTTSTTKTVQQSAYCPSGNCPTNRTQRRGGLLRGLFR